MSLSKKHRDELKGKFGGRCAYCGCDLGQKWHADHIEPVIRRGEWVRVDKPNQSHVFKATGEVHRPQNERLDNYFPSCVKCNLHKGTFSVEGFRKMLNMHLDTLSTAPRFSYYQHAKRFGLIQEIPKAIIFYFEEFEGRVLE